jgi:ankyrin repeat protein
MLAFLLERALDPNTQSYAGQTPLHVAAGRGHDACIRLLLSDNAQPDLGGTWSSCVTPPVLQSCCIPPELTADAPFALYHCMFHSHIGRVANRKLGVLHQTPVIMI